MRRLLGRCALALGVATLLVAGLDRAFPPDLVRYRERSLEVLDRDGRLLRLYPTSDGMLRLATTPDVVDQRYLDLLLRREDRRFWQHPGVDPFALARAVWQLARTGHVVSGGSTLTMQVARLLTPHRHDIVGKLVDIARALQLEAHFDKREILSMYLTLAPMGGNLEGVRAAARAYFGHEPGTLRPEEAALLVAIPQSPSRLRPDRHDAAARAALAKVLAQAGPNILTGSGDDPSLPRLSRKPEPMRALHLADRLHMRGETGAVRTTIDATLQIAVENLAVREASWSGDHANIAALVVANRDRSVLAYLGGSDYFGADGMVDMIGARRSPGSALKPFIYGLAIDESLITPDTIIDDAPLLRGAYGPQNFDRLFHGAVTAREALQQSYNLPAVRVLEQLGPGRFAADLRAAGAHLAFPHQTWSPGLPLALGGVGISLGDLAMLYTALADDGEARPLRLEAGERPGAAAALMSASAAAQIEDVLRGVPPPDAIAPGSRAIAYKTGTSYGFRDALAVGSSGDYTVAVWIGRTDGTPRPDAYGRAAAAPILFQIFDLLPPESAPQPAPVAPARTRPRAAALQRLRAAAGWQNGAGDNTSALEILFPPAGATIALGRNRSAIAPLTLEAVGGVPPYRWMINGEILPSPPTGAAATWYPDGPGFATVSVIDARQHAAVADFRIE